MQKQGLTQDCPNISKDIEGDEPWKIPIINNICNGSPTHAKYWSGLDILDVSLW